MRQIGRHALALIALGTSTAAAQAPAASPVVQSLKTFVDQYTPWITAAFDSIPAERYAFRPTPAQQSVGYIAQHIEFSAYQLCSLFGGSTHAVTARDSLADTIKAKWPKDSLVARVRAAFQFCNNAFPGSPTRCSPTKSRLARRPQSASHHVPCSASAT